MKKRRFKRNPDCPLTRTERTKLCKYLDEMEWREYYPLKHISGAYADATVYGYDELRINIQLKWGVDGQGDSSGYTADFDIDRNTFEDIF